MSRVTNIIIAASSGENAENLVSQLRVFQVNGIAFNVVPIDDVSLPKLWYGGTKCMEATLLIGAYNYLDLEKLIMFMRNEVVWSDPEDVQLIVKEQDEFKFRIIDVFPINSI